MARVKRITIEGSNILTDLSQPWGGVNNTAVDVTVYNTVIPPGYEWGVNKDEVERFQKSLFGSKVSCFEVDSGILYGFATEADRAAWLEEPDDSYVLCQVTLPAGGGDTATDTLAIYGIDNTQYYAKGSEEVVLKFKVRNIIDGEPSADINCYVLNAQNAVVASALRPTADSDGYYSLTVSGSALRNVANTSEVFTLRVERAGEERQTTRLLTMACVDLGLELYSGYNFSTPSPQNIIYIPSFATPPAGVSIKLVVDVWNSSLTVRHLHTETLSISSNNQATVALPWQDMESLTRSGVVMVKAHLDLGNGLVQSKEVVTPVIYVAAGDEDSVSFIAIEPLGNVTLYDTITPRIAVYYKGENYANVQITLNGGTPTLLSVNTRFVYSDHTIPIEQTSNTLRARVMEEESIVATATATFTAVGAFNWSTIAGYEHNLTGRGRSNDELPTPANWGGITTFTGFSWNTAGSCWKDGALHLTGGSKAVINIAPFYSTTAYDSVNRIGGGILDTGRTFRVRFKVGNVFDTSKKIIHCWDEVNKVGFYVTADTVYVRMGNDGEITTDASTPQSNRNDRHFRVGEVVELCVTMQPSWDSNGVATQKMATMYINGQFAGYRRLSNTTLSQSEAIPVTIEADGCELDVYQVTPYNKCLDSFEVLQNSVMALGSLNEMVAEFNKNQCYRGSGEVSFNETFKYCIDLSASLGDTVEGTCNIIVNTYTFDPSVSDTSVYPNDKQELELFFFRNGDVDTTRSVKYAAKGDGDLRVRIQGTSTASEFRKNMRYDGRGKDDNNKRLYEFRWSREAYEAGGSLNPSDGWVGWDASTETWSKTDGTSDKQVKKMSIYVRGNSSTENACSLLTVKTNYNESTATRNLPMARWIDDAINFLAVQRDGNGNLLFPTILTPPQRTDAKVRQAIDGVPAVQFTRAIGETSPNRYYFSGKVDLITDKKNSGVFGFSKNGPHDTENPVAHPDYSIEFRNGNSDTCCFRCPDLSRAGKYLNAQFSQLGQDCLEYRWPDLDTGDVYYGDRYVCTDSAIQRLFDFVFNCHPDFIGYKSKNGVISLTEGEITILGETAADTAANRRSKFYAEMGNYLVKDSVTFQSFVTKVLMWTDQRAKNQFFTHYAGDEIESAYTDELNVQGQTYEVLRLLPYDIDTSLRGDNASLLRFNFTRLYTDAYVYNDVVDDTGIGDDSHGSGSVFYPTQEAISDAATFIQNRVSGKQSALYELLDATCQAEYAQYFSLLSAGYLNLEALSRYCITGEADAFNSVIYNADTQYKYLSSSNPNDAPKAHGSAREDLLWWLDGRMYFMGGENSAGDFVGVPFSGVLAPDGALDATNLAMRVNSGSPLRIKSSYRNYLATVRGTGVPSATTYANDPTQYVELPINVSSVANEDAGRFKIFGQKFFEDVEDFSKLYIRSITSWGGCTQLKTLKFGDDAAGFENPLLTDITNNGDIVFGACETVDLRNCTAYSNSHFECFPAAKTILLEGCESLTELRLPTTDNLVTLQMPKNISTLELANKSKVTSLSIENGGGLTGIVCDNISNVTAVAVLSFLNQFYNS